MGKSNDGVTHDDKGWKVKMWPQYSYTEICQKQLEMLFSNNRYYYVVCCEAVWSAIILASCTSCKPCKEISDSTGAWIGFHVCSHCNADADTRCVLIAYNASKCDCSQTLPRPRLHSIPPDPVAGFKGAASARWRGREETGSKWRIG